MRSGQRLQNNDLRVVIAASARVADGCSYEGLALPDAWARRVLTGGGMGRLSCGTVLALGFVVGSCSADAPPDYGPPDSATTIDLQAYDRGLGFPPHLRIEGTQATYSENLKTGQATVATADVAAIIHTLEDVEFLDISDEDTSCEEHDNAWSYTSIDVSLSAGSNLVSLNRACSGGVFDQLGSLVTMILDRSGFNAWEAMEFPR